MKVIIKWSGLPASQQGEKIILMDQLQTGFLKLCTMDFKAFFIIHDVQGEFWISSEGTYQEMKELYNETLREELS